MEASADAGPPPRGLCGGQAGRGTWAAAASPRASSSDGSLPSEPDRATHPCSASLGPSLGQEYEMYVHGRMCICLDLSFGASTVQVRAIRCMYTFIFLSMKCQPRTFSWTRILECTCMDGCAYYLDVCFGASIVQVINHGISQSVMDGAIEAASDFFKQPKETKEEFASDDLRQPVRYDTSSKDSISMSRAFVKHYAHPLSDWIQYWPQQPPVYREYMGNCAVEVRRVALQLMQAILEGLELGKEYQYEKFQEGLQLLSVNCYPKVSQGATAIGLAPHSDYGFLTILLTSCQGLEVVDRSCNGWKTVQQLPHALHVHMGDHMEVLSNGRVKTVVHRAVLNPEEARISIASIHGFALHEKVTCAKELVDEQNPQKYKESSFSDFLDHLMANMDNKNRNFLESLRMTTEHN